MSAARQTNWARSHWFWSRCGNQVVSVNFYCLRVLLESGWLGCRVDKKTKQNTGLFYGVDLSVWGAPGFNLNLTTGQARLARMLMRRKLTIVARWHVSGAGVRANLCELPEVELLPEKKPIWGTFILLVDVSCIFTSFLCLFLLFLFLSGFPLPYTHLD